MSSNRESQSVQRAKSILRGQSAEIKEINPLTIQLKAEKAFGYARKLLQYACLRPELGQDQQLRTWCIHQHALCTYKDWDLSPEIKFDRALTILKQLGDLRTTKDQETLGLVGAIHKYKWEAYGQKQDLEQSLAFYLRGYTLGVRSDYGYTAINAAFVLDLLANLDLAKKEQTGLVPESVATRQQEAKRLREEIIAALPPLLEQPETQWLAHEWWFFATIAEAYLGLGKYTDDYYREAGDWLQKGRQQTNVQEWELESTARQLATLAHLQETDSAQPTSLKNTSAWKVVSTFLVDKYANGIEGIFLGKVGLALSGGGFRASLFHIGVLARLAELDILRHVEVLSCVSGGSIIGAHYYLEVRKVLQTKEDGQIMRDDYIDIVRRIETDFLAGVQRNIRMRVLADFSANLQMVFTPNTYSRTQRVGELYEEEIFSRIDDGNGMQPRYMSDLLIQPAGEPPSFSPKADNWRRSAKVPMLILNATALNTGHNWQFTATWMGEPPAGIDAEIDSNYRLRRMYYDEAPKEHQQVRLGQAVAASACVPGLFDPVVFTNLYPDLTVRLVDGGVHDNQGVASLLEQGCSVILVSDASGQMEAQNEPSNGILGPPLRSNAILQARVREAQYYELEARRRASLLRGLMFVHLKKDLENQALNWVDCEDPQDALDGVPLPGSQGVLTPYGLRKDVQERLAAIRTDLDSFTDKEAYALMTSGYRMTEQEMRDNLQTLFPSDGVSTQWKFLAIEPALQQRDEAKELSKFLGASSELFFKVWRLLPRWQQRTLLALIGVPTVIVFFWACMRWASFPLLTLGMIGTTTAAIVAGFLVGKTIIKVVRFRDTLTRIAIGIGMSLVGCLLAQIHLRIFDQWYLKEGKVDVEKNQLTNP